MAGNYGPSGALFVNDRKQKDTHPDYEGSLDLDEELVRSLVDQLKKGLVPKLDVKGWKKTSKTGKPFLSLSPKLPYKMNEATGGGGSSRGGRVDDPF